MRVVSALTFAAAMAAGTMCAAQPQDPPVVQVGLGLAVAKRSADLGESELHEQALYLAKDVLRSIERRRERPVRVQLSIVDIEPNLPTSAQLGASAQLKQSSFGLGGASVEGEVTLADNRVLPVRYRFFPTSLRNDASLSTWDDADQAFDNLSALLGYGRVPDDPSVWPRPHTARAVTGTLIAR